MALPGGGKTRRMARAPLSFHLLMSTPDADYRDLNHPSILLYTDSPRERSTGALLLLKADRLPPPPRRCRPHLGPL